jgi:zinc transport system substrate-binding protein
VITRIVLIIVCAAALTSGCGANGPASGKKTVVAAFYPLAYAAERLAGSRYAVDNLTPPGAEPHDLELTAKAVARIESADVVLYLGRGFSRRSAQPSTRRTERPSTSSRACRCTPRRDRRTA